MSTQTNTQTNTQINISTDEQLKKDEEDRKKKNQQSIFIGLMVVGIIVFIVLAVIGRKNWEVFLSKRSNKSVQYVNPVNMSTGVLTEKEVLKYYFGGDVASLLDYLAILCAGVGALIIFSAAAYTAAMVFSR